MKVAILTKHAKETGQGPYILNEISVSEAKRKFAKKFKSQKIVDAFEVKFNAVTGEWVKPSALSKE